MTTQDGLQWHIWSYNKYLENEQRYEKTLKQIIKYVILKILSFRETTKFVNSLNTWFSFLQNITKTQNVAELPNVKIIAKGSSEGASSERLLGVWGKKVKKAYLLIHSWSGKVWQCSVWRQTILLIMSKKVFIEHLFLKIKTKLVIHQCMHCAYIINDEI